MGLFYAGLSISIIIVSWTLGLITNLLLQKSNVYLRVSNLNFIKNRKINLLIGVVLFKKLLVRSFWRKLNPTLNIKQSVNLDNLVLLRKEVVNSEVIHLSAFIIICVTAAVLRFAKLYEQMVYPLLVANVVLNLYPVFVQQYNKRRIAKSIDVLLNRSK